MQAVLLSLLPSNLLLPSPPSNDSLRRLLVWYKEEAHTLIKALTVEHSCAEGLSTVQVLVGLLRAMGLRARLVLSLNPIPFKGTHPLHMISVEGEEGIMGVVTDSSSVPGAASRLPSVERGSPDQPAELGCQPSSIKDTPTLGPNQKDHLVLPATRKRSAGKYSGRGHKSSKLPREEGGGVNMEDDLEMEPKGKKRKNEVGVSSSKEGTCPQGDTPTSCGSSCSSVEGPGKSARGRGHEPLSSDRRRSLRSHDRASADGEGGGRGGGAICDEGSSDVVMDAKGKRRKRERVSPRCKGGDSDCVMAAKPSGPTRGGKNVSLYGKGTEWLWVVSIGIKGGRGEGGRGKGREGGRDGGGGWGWEERGGAYYAWSYGAICVCVHGNNCTGTVMQLL